MLNIKEKLSQIIEKNEQMLVHYELNRPECFNKLIIKVDYQKNAIILSLINVAENWRLQGIFSEVLSGCIDVAKLKGMDFIVEDVVSDCIIHYLDRLGNFCYFMDNEKVCFIYKELK